MKSFDRTELLDQLELRSEKHISTAIRCFQNSTPLTLLSQPEGGGWSIAQCLWHLNSYGDYYLPLISEALESAADAAEADLFKSTKLGDYFANLMEPGPQKKKIKAFKKHTPGTILDPYEVTAEFIRQQEVLLACITLARKKDLNKIKIPVSIMPILKLRLGDVFRFLIAHNERHLQQAKRNLTFMEEINVRSDAPTELQQSH